MGKPQLLKYTEWQGANGCWYCNDTSDLASPRSLWWAPARMMNISPADYVQWLIKEFKPDTIVYNQEKDVLRISLMHLRENIIILFKEKMK